MPLLQAMEDVCDESNVGAFGSWNHDSRRLFPHRLAKENIACGGGVRPKLETGQSLISFADILAQVVEWVIRQLKVNGLIPSSSRPHVELYSTPDTEPQVSPDVSWMSVCV